MVVVRLSYLSVAVSALALLASCAPPGTQPRETFSRETYREDGPGIPRSSAGAECDSRDDDPYLSGLNWASLTYQLYTICYDERYKDDVAIVKRWIDAALELGWQKYGVARPTYRGRPIHTTVFLPPVPTQYTSEGLVQVKCCWTEGLVSAELHYLTPSAWLDNPLGGLGIPAKDYHPHYVMHEMLHVVQYSFPQGSRSPSWIIEGLAEYDSFFYTTRYNRTTAIDLLIRHVHRYDREKIFCCRTLGSSGIATTSVYYGAAVIMMFLAERFGEGIHVDLLTTPLEEVLKRRGTTVTKTFDELRAWFEQRVQALGETSRAQLQATSRTQLREAPSSGAEGLTAAPVFSEDERTSREVSENMRRGTNVGAPVEATSPNGDPLTYSLTDPTNSFTIDSETGQLKTMIPLDYEERSNYEVMVEVSNSVGSASILVTINVMDENDAPAAKNDTAKTDENEPVTIAVLANDKDQDGDRLTIVGTTGPPNGVVVIGDGATTVTYRPNTGFIGTDTFDYTVSDGTATATARVTVKVQHPLGERINRVNETVLPEVARAMSASLIEAVTRRVETADSGLNPAGQALYHALESGAQALEEGRLDLGQELANSSFTLPVKVTEGGGRVGDLALWGRGDYRRLSGAPESPDASAADESQLGWNGDLFSVHLGADDLIRSDLLLGVALSWSGGRFDYGDDSGASGNYRSRIVSLNPYLSWTSAAGLRLWATVGYGRGEIGFADEREVGERSSGVSMALVAAGLSGTLFEDDELIEGGTTSLDLEGEGSLARVFIEGDGDLIESLAVNIQHLRLVLEGSHSRRLAGGAALTPSLELALRYDSGAGVNGLRAEVGGGLSYVDPGLGLTLALTGRGRLLLRDQGGYGEWGVSGLVKLGPRADGRGLFFSLAPSYGEPASRIEQLSVSPVSSYQLDQRVAGRLAMELGYGLSALAGEALLTPYSGMSLASGESQRFRAGTRFEIAESLELSLEGERRTGIGGADHGVTVRGEVRF